MSSTTNISIEQGADFQTVLTLTDSNGDPLDLFGYTAYSKMKKWYTSLTSISFNTSIDVSNGAITLELDASTTINIKAGRYVYDVEINNGTTTSRIVEGLVYVTPTVTGAI